MSNSPWKSKGSSETVTVGRIWQDGDKKWLGGERWRRHVADTDGIPGYQGSRVDTHGSIGLVDLVGRDRAGRRGPCAIQLRYGKCRAVLPILGISISILNFEA
jgi:hypothetical protein